MFHENYPHIEQNNIIPSVEAHFKIIVVYFESKVSKSLYEQVEWTWRLHRHEGLMQEVQSYSATSPPQIAIRIPIRMLTRSNRVDVENICHCKPSRQKVPRGHCFEIFAPTDEPLSRVQFSQNCQRLSIILIEL